jgi:hypothetical protein
MIVVRKTAHFVLLIAFCILAIGFTLASYHLVKSVHHRMFSGQLLLLAIGFVAYIPLHLVFRKFIIVHVFSHELTHALWAMLFGGKVEEIYVSGKSGGYTTHTKSNFVVALAPYFFPLYSFILLALFFVIQDTYKSILLVLLGFSLGFHLLLTLHALRLGQSDLRKHGVVFSLVFIYTMNCLVFGLILCAVDQQYALGKYMLDGLSIYKELPIVIKMLSGWRHGA